MEKGFTRIIVVVLAAMIFGSSAFSAQFLPRTDLQQQAAVVHQVQAEQAEKTDSSITKILSLIQVQDEQSIAKEQQASTSTQQNVPATPSKKETKQPKPQAYATKEDKPAAAAPVPSTNTSPETAENQTPAATTPTTTTTPSAPAPAPVVEVKTPANPYSLGSGRDFRFLSKAVVKNTGTEASLNVRIQIPLITESSLYFSRKSESFSIQPTEITTVNGTRMGVFHLGDMEPGQEITIAIHTLVRTSTITFFADYVPTENNPLNSYLNASSGIESNDGTIINLSSQLTAGLNTDYDKARAITKWVANNIAYDANAANRNSGALAALQTRKGVCEDYAKLSAALARAAGIPARIVFGYTDTGNNWPASGAFALRGYRHAWVEFYLVGRGWAPADPTRSSSTKLYFGSLVHNRYIIQNYNNQSIKGNYNGGKISVNWVDSLE